MGKGIYFRFLGGCYFRKGAKKKKRPVLGFGSAVYIFATNVYTDTYTNRNTRTAIRVLRVVVDLWINGCGSDEDERDGGDVQ